MKIVDIRQLVFRSMRGLVVVLVKHGSKNMLRLRKGWSRQFAIQIASFFISQSLQNSFIGSLMPPEIRESTFGWDCRK